MRVFKISALFVMLATQLFAFPDMKFYSHQILVSNEIDIYTTPEENAVILSRTKKTNPVSKRTSDFFYGYDEVTQCGVLIKKSRQGGYYCMVENSDGKTDVSKEFIEGRQDGFRAFWFSFEEGRFVCLEHKNELYGFFQSF